MKNIQIKDCQASSKKTSNPENLFDDFTWLIRDQTPNSLAQCILGHPFELRWVKRQNNAYGQFQCCLAGFSYVRQATRDMQKHRLNCVLSKSGTSLSPFSVNMKRETSISS